MFISYLSKRVIRYVNFFQNMDLKLKQVTTKKNAGELDQAIDLLRKKNRYYFKIK